MLPGLRAGQTEGGVLRVTPFLCIVKVDGSQRGGSIDGRGFLDTGGFLLHAIV